MSADFIHLMAARRSVSTVTDAAPTDEQLREVLTAVVPVADHKSLRPWRLVEHRGSDRLRLGEALARAGLNAGEEPDAERLEHYCQKALRAPLVIAVIAERRSSKVPKWEQEAVASGAAHLLELALFAAGWGVMWRSGDAAGSDAVRNLYGLDQRDRHLGWLYVGGISPQVAERMAEKPKKRLDPAEFIGSLPSAP